MKRRPTTMRAKGIDRLARKMRRDGVEAEGTDMSQDHAHEDHVRRADRGREREHGKGAELRVDVRGAGVMVRARKWDPLYY